MIDDRPEMLDVYCCSGGGAKGYQKEGWKVDGIDKKPRPNYCGDGFELGDAVEILARLIWTGEIERYKLVHTSPPCQAGCAMKKGTNDSKGWGRQDHDQLVPITRELLLPTGIPFVIEQPQGHGGLIRTDLRLCMDMFRDEIGPPPWVQRHRDFEIHGFEVAQPAHPGGAWNRHEGRVRGYRHGEWFDGPYVAAYGDGGGKPSVEEMQHALGIDWTADPEELKEAIPPAYGALIGRAAFAQLVPSLAA